MIYPGEFGGAYTVKEETIDDAVAAVALANTIPGADKKEIYLLGHSLGGMLAPRIAGLAPNLKGIILAEAPARKFTDLLDEQNKYICLPYLKGENCGFGHVQLMTVNE